MSNLISHYIAFLLIIFMLSMAYFSMIDDSAIMDEVAHLPAGYSYVTQQDMRINPEHPPLIKDLAGGFVVLMSEYFNIPINFPSDIKAWTQDINGQWDFGFDFMYKEGNSADLMLFAGRLPMIMILVLLGFYIYRWVRKTWGNTSGLLALFLFSFSPTFIAHGRFVTTDVAAAAAFFIATFYFIRWLRNPKWQTLVLAGVSFGLAQLAKFSLFLIVPLFCCLIIAWIIVKLADNITEREKPIDPSSREALFANPLKEPPVKKESWYKIVLRYLVGICLIFAIGYGLIVTPVYYFHVKNYPVEKQIQDMRYILKSYAGGPDEKELASCTDLQKIKRCPAELVIWTADKSMPVRAFGQYMFGLLMVVQRASGGNTTYFMNEVSASGWKTYFPTVYLLKEPLALHILTLLAITIFIWQLIKKPKIPIATEKNTIRRFLYWLGLNFEGFTMLCFIALYWASSINSPLNIGVRHVLPTFPFIFALIASQIGHLFEGWGSKGKNLLVVASVVVIALLAWQAFSVLKTYPSFLAYFNELAGGPKNGYKYAVDSNLDWGQDLKRLNKWVDNYNNCYEYFITDCSNKKDCLPQNSLKECDKIKNYQGGPIEEIYVDYFGGGDAKYYLGDKFLPWWGTRSPSDLKSGDWLAVSATFIQGGRGNPVPGFNQPNGYYKWLDKIEPAATIGHSIFVYQIP